MTDALISEAVAGEALETLRDVLNIVTGWTRPLTPDEKLEQIQLLCEDALRELA